MYKTENDGFIKTTAQDYDMTPYQVLNIYNKNVGIDGELNVEEFYSDLEYFVNVRANQ